MTFLLTRVLGASLLLSGCGRAGATAPAPSGAAGGGAGSSSADSHWTDVIEQLRSAESSKSAFSLSYVGRFEGEEFVTSRWLQAIVWDDVLDNACDDVDVLSREPSAASKARWFLQVETSAPALGTYPIVPSLDLLQQRAQADVFLKRVLGKGELERRTALAGSVEIISAPQSEEEWNAGVVLSARLTAEFPEVAAREGRCTVSGAVDATPPPPTCDCELSDGRTFTCLRTGEYSCCHDLEAARRSFEVSFEAGQCARMCTGTSLTSQHCLTLN
jgi:hypothetical protein